MTIKDSQIIYKLIFMRLKLTNFRCWTEKTFVFPDIGLILLNGESGKGKSTVLLAIQFCLFGNVRKVATFGSTGAKVEMEYKNLKIMRQSKPKKLVVNGVLEDAEAQNLIEATLGMNYHNFLISSIIRQKEQASILSLSPGEQISLIERIALDENEVSDIKKKIQAQVKVRNDELVKANTEFEYAQKEYESIDQQIPLICNPC